MKVGNDVDQDIRRLEAVHHALPGIAFIGDGNQRFTREDCLAFARGGLHQYQNYEKRLTLCKETIAIEEHPSIRGILRDSASPRFHNPI